MALFQLEDSEQTLKRRLEAMSGGVWPRDLFVHVAPFKLVPETYDATLEACRGAALVIVDPVIQAGEVMDWNSQSEVRTTYDQWRRLSRDTDAAVVLACHHRKLAGDFGDQLAGSIQAQATVDGILELYRDPNLDKLERKLSFVGRDWADREDEVIRLDTTTLTWGPAGTFRDTLAEVKEARRSVKANEVLEALPQGPPGRTYAELVETTKMSRDRVREALRSMGKKVHSAGKGNKADPLRFWRAA